tara:strand:- start:247 stop:624 length:378 start_codon:yes stop_codon:yes gene_type:complete
MTFNAIFFALGIIAFPLLSSAIKVIHVLSTGKTWMTQSDIEIEKTKIKTSSIIKRKNLKIEELQSQCHQYKQDAKQLTSSLLEQEEALLSLANENLALKNENLKLQSGLENLFERLEKAEKKLGK